MRRSFGIDKPLLLFILALVAAGGLIFASAVFGLLARGGLNMSAVAGKQALWIGAGIVALLIASRLNYKLWRRFTPYLFAGALLFTAAVFIPQLGFEHGGGRRWLSLFGFSVQPAEFLKIASILMAATYFATIRPHIGDIRWGLGGLAFILAGPAVILVAQPDIGTLGVIIASVFAVFFAAGARWRDLLIVILLGIVTVAALAIVKPYVRDRVTIFLNPSQAPQAEGYQIRQSLIAVGSGGIVGRGFGQSVQKFTYLPEPMGDSIFAVAAEEFGFVGSFALIGTFLALALRGFSVATRAPDAFGGLLAIGISTYLVAESYINIASMLGLAPLTGIPLTFISQGGSAMLASLGSAGILLSVSRHASKH
ncbi:cell division protein FtsW [Candidatus Kaiserbacteria bacterium]|nr:cell division protein FtsW [Candidatus Kaiserbacteria bacterium]